MLVNAGLHRPFLSENCRNILMILGNSSRNFVYSQKARSSKHQKRPMVQGFALSKINSLSLYLITIYRLTIVDTRNLIILD